MTNETEVAWQRLRLPPIQDVYDQDSIGTGNYLPMLQSLGTVVVQVDENDYQGDSLVLYHQGSQWGVLQFGWGSCSGCDALQACDSYTDLEELRLSLVSAIRWGTADETLAYLRYHDWEGDFIDNVLVADFVRHAEKVIHA